MHFSRPTISDGKRVYELIKECPPLDVNSRYCNMLQCEHFSETSVLAEIDSDVVGFVSGYKPPTRSDTLFVWQVAVANKARGFGLASRMITQILSRPENEGVSQLETTITQGNKSSWRLFNSLARNLGAGLRSAEWMNKDEHFCGVQESEHLVQIGPIGPIGKIVAREVNENI